MPLPDGVRPARTCGRLLPEEVRAGEACGTLLPDGVRGAGTWGVDPPEAVRAGEGGRGVNGGLLFGAAPPPILPNGGVTTGMVTCEIG
ncbi:MAG: hypothetical protein ACYC8T_02955 [Myxococcaceae bacterium]